MTRGGLTAKWRARGTAAAKRAVGLRRVLDFPLRAGPYGKGWMPGRSGLSLRTLVDAPHGLVLGPLESCLPARLFTPDKSVQLAPDALLADVPRLDRTLEEHARPAAGLALIGRRTLRSNNSWMHNSTRLVKGAPRCTLLVHPYDASARGIGDGDLVTVRSGTGAIEVAASVTSDISPGVVSLPHGWGQQRPGVQLRVAAGLAGASLNDITDDTRLDAVSGNAAFSGTWVTVERS
jgi:anaerobic selenocysteine-containing dehydrogenase